MGMTGKYEVLTGSLKGTRRSVTKGATSPIAP